MDAGRTYLQMGSVSVSLIELLLLLSLSFVFVNGGIPTTLDGPFEPVTVPLDKSFRGNAVDLPDTDPRVQRIVEGFEPEQISVSLSATYDSVWVSWITGLYDIPLRFEFLFIELSESRLDSGQRYGLEVKLGSGLVECDKWVL